MKTRHAIANRNGEHKHPATGAILIKYPPPRHSGFLTISFQQAFGKQQRENGVRSDS